MDGPPSDPEDRLAVVYLKGVAMGAADAVPGVSGGTIALIAGIYDRLIGAINGFDVALLSSALGAHDPGQRDQLTHRLEQMDIPFLLVLGLGIVSALVGLAEIITVALTEYTALTFAFFFGLIAASALALGTAIAVRSRWELASGVAGFAVAFLLTGDGGVSLAHNPVIVFLSGAIAVSAMVLPGISGSFLLLILDQYEYVFASLAALVDGLQALNPGEIVQHGAVVVTFGAGAIVGVLTTARVVEAALRRARAVTLTFLIGLMLGALRLPYTRILSATPEFTVTGFLALIAVGGLGAASILIGYRAGADVV
jgi:putative membrane protein